MGPDEGQVARLLAMMDGGEKPRRAGYRRVRAVLLAAAVCAALAATAVAVSPTLQEQLAGLLGGFGAYSQRVEGVSCVENGVEITVLSAMADTSMVKVYAEARDLSAENRLSGAMDVFGGVSRERPEPETTVWGGSTAVEGECVGFDAEAGAALLEFSVWGTPEIERDGLSLTVIGLYPNGLGGENGIGAGENAEGEIWKMPLTVEKAPERVCEAGEAITLESDLGTCLLRQVLISPLGVSVRTDGEGGAYQEELKVTLTSGETVILPYGGSGQFFDGDDPKRITCWEFDEPVEPDKVAGLELHGIQIGLDGGRAGTARA